MDIDRLEFIASLPPIASAIQIHGIGDGAIIKLEIPASEIHSIVQLQLLAGKIFKVTIEEIEDRRYGRKKTKTD
jgi:hypothetical protein